MTVLLPDLTGGWRGAVVYNKPTVRVAKAPQPSGLVPGTAWVHGPADALQISTQTKPRSQLR